MGFHLSFKFLCSEYNARFADYQGIPATRIPATPPNDEDEERGRGMGTQLIFGRDGKGTQLIVIELRPLFFLIPEGFQQLAPGRAAHPGVRCFREFRP